MIRNVALILPLLLAHAWVHSAEPKDRWSDPTFREQFLGTYGVLGEAEPRPSPVEREQLEKVIPLMASDQDQAVQVLSAAVAAGQTGATLEFTLGNLYFQKDQLEDAAKWYRSALAKFPNYARAHKNLGLVQFRNGQMAEAITSMTRMIELGRGDALTYGLLGHAYSQVGESLSAESAYRLAILLDSRTMDWPLGLARVLLKQERYADAAALCGGLIEKHPDRADLWLLQANAYLALDQPIKAAQNYEALSRLGQATVETLNTLGDIYVNQGLMDLASEAYLRAIELDPAQDAEGPLRKAEVLAARGANDQAKTLIGRIEKPGGMALDETARRRMLKLRARIAAADGQGDDAIAVLEQIVALDPLDGEALMQLGQAHSRAGHPEQALMDYERAEGASAFEADAKVHRAQILVAQEKYAEALPLLKRAQELKPRDEVARYVEQVERAARGKGGKS
jgi:tetratricopeptide (TPR) repeat protein